MLLLVLTPRRLLLMMTVSCYPIITVLVLLLCRVVGMTRTTLFGGTR